MITMARPDWGQFCRDELADWRELLPRLTPEQWRTASLCEGFTVADVVGHLALARAVPLWTVLVQLARFRGDLDRLSYVESRAFATEHGPSALTEIFIRETQRRPERGLARIEPARRVLSDALTHRLDVCWPLGIEVDVPAARMVACLDAVVRLRDWGCRRTAKGLALRATDVNWAHGAGPTVAGPAQALLLAIGRRPAGLATLSGPGLDALAQRITARPRTSA